MNLALDNIDLPSLTKSTLVAILVEKIGLNKREAGDMVDSFFTIITEQLVAGEEVRIADFASFLVRTKAPRPGRNPRTGAEVEISGRRVLVFQTGPNLKTRLKSSIQ